MMLNEDPALETATLLFQIGGGAPIPYEFGGVAHEIDGYRKSAWIGTPLSVVTHLRCIWTGCGKVS